MLKNNVEQIEAYLVDYLKKKYGDKVNCHYNENDDLIADLPKDDNETDGRTEERH